MSTEPCRHVEVRRQLDACVRAFRALRPEFNSVCASFHASYPPGGGYFVVTASADGNPAVHKFKATCTDSGEVFRDSLLYLWTFQDSLWFPIPDSGEEVHK